MAHDIPTLDRIRYVGGGTYLKPLPNDCSFQAASDASSANERMLLSDLKACVLKKHHFHLEMTSSFTSDSSKPDEALEASLSAWRLQPFGEHFTYFPPPATRMRSKVAILCVMPTGRFETC